MKKFLFVFISIVLLSRASAHARDINLDEIYIKNTSGFLKNLMNGKLDIYEKINASFVDRDIIFSGWITGNNIIYIKEFSSADLNIIYRFDANTQRSEEICRLNGAVVYAWIPSNGAFIYLKRMIAKTGIIPKGELIIINLANGEKREFPRLGSPFLDFTVSFSGNSILYDSRRGFFEYSAQTKRKTLLISKGLYQDIIATKNPSLAFESPDRKKHIIINGGGGNYNAKILINRKPAYHLTGFTSSSEIIWIDNNRFVYRKGYTGNFSIHLHSIITRKSKMLVSHSFNTNLTYSHHPGMICFLKDQIIHVYRLSPQRLINTGLEGEDISFDSYGSRFTVLMYKKLFIVNINAIARKRIEMQRGWQGLLGLYKKLLIDPSSYENSFSSDYIRRKISNYQQLIQN